MTTPLPATTKPALREPQFFLDEMNQAYQLGVVDLQRLRETNVRQRELILELEQRLSSTLPGQKPNEDTQKLIEKLRLQLRDYDTCTVILEGESESLRERISTLTLILSEEDDPPIASDFMFPEMAQHYFQARRDLDKTSFEMMREVAGADDLSQAATALTAFFQRQKLHCVLFVRGHDQQLWMASDGLVDPRIKVLLQSMEGNDKPSRTNSGNSLILLLPLCRLHITGTALGSADGEMVKGFMSRMMVIVDLIFGQIDRISGSKSPVDAEETIHFRQLLTSIEARYRYLDSETRRIATDHRQEMESTLMSLPLSPGQKIVVEGLLGDFTAEIDLVTRAATSIHENLQLAVRTLGGHA